jgi:hypothetical protein
MRRVRLSFSPPDGEPDVGLMVWPKNGPSFDVTGQRARSCRHHPLTIRSITSRVRIVRVVALLCGSPWHPRDLRQVPKRTGPFGAQSARLSFRLVRRRWTRPQLSGLTPKTEAPVAGPRSSPAACSRPEIHREILSNSRSQTFTCCQRLPAYLNSSSRGLSRPR